MGHKEVETHILNGPEVVTNRSEDSGRWVKGIHVAGVAGVGSAHKSHCQMIEICYAQYI